MGFCLPWINLLEDELDLGRSEGGGQGLDGLNEAIDLDAAVGGAGRGGDLDNGPRIVSNGLKEKVTLCLKI